MYKWAFTHIQIYNVHIPVQLLGGKQSGQNVIVDDLLRIRGMPKPGGGEGARVMAMARKEWIS